MDWNNLHFIYVLPIFCNCKQATHASSNTLPELKSLFERKLEERKHFDASHIRGSPEIGNIFINYPGAGGSDRKVLIKNIF